MARRKQLKKVDAEHLEVRQMLTGDISVVLQHNVLTLNEAPGHVGEASNIQISQLANGQIRVAAFGYNIPLSKVNGNLSADFTPANGVPVTVVTNLGGGHDQLVVANGTKLNNATLNLGGNGSDIDTVHINGLTTKGSLTINTGSDVDTINIENSNIGDGVGIDNLNINTGRGRDTVNVGGLTSWSNICGSLTVRTFEAADTETDTVSVNLLEVSKNIEINTGNGEDIINMLGATGGLDIKISAGEDRDIVTLRDTRAIDEFFVDLGAGDDTLHLNFVQANWFKALGGAGTDRLAIQNPSSTLIQFEDFSYFNGKLVRPVLPRLPNRPLNKI